MGAKTTGAAYSVCNASITLKRRVLSILYSQTLSCSVQRDREAKGRNYPRFAGARSSVLSHLFVQVPVSLELKFCEYLDKVFFNQRVLVWELYSVSPIEPFLMEKVSFWTDVCHLICGCRFSNGLYWTAERFSGQKGCYVTLPRHLLLNRWNYYRPPGQL